MNIIRNSILLYDDMPKINIKKLSIQSLQAFNALYQTKNVTRAAETINITQAAMSNILKQLRLVFDDELFIRQSQGVLPTNLANEIAPKIEQAIKAIENVLVTDEVEPAYYFDTINIALSDYGEALILPKLYASLSKHNGDVKINVKRFYEKIDIMDFRQGDIMLAVGILKEPSSELYSTTLFTEHAVCVMNEDHPFANQPLTLDNYQKAKHIAFMPYKNSKQSFIDDVLINLSIKRDIAITATHLTTVLNLIEGYPLIGTLPEQLSLSMGLQTHSKLLIKPAPFAITPCDVKLFWHKNDDQHPAHQWLRRLITEEVLVHPSTL